MTNCALLAGAVKPMEFTVQQVYTINECIMLKTPATIFFTTKMAAGGWDRLLVQILLFILLSVKDCFQSLSYKILISLKEFELNCGRFLLKNSYKASCPVETSWGNGISVSCADSLVSDGYTKE